MSPSMIRAHAHGLLSGGLIITLSACHSMASLAGEGFILEGQLPPDFSLKALAHYGVANNCEGRARPLSFESGFQSTSQQYHFEIPVSYREGLCEMRLSRVGLFIHGRYGDKDWQQTYDNGGLVLVNSLPQGAPAFQADGALSKTAECSWLFKLSTAKSRLGQIDKLLSCKGAGAHLVRQELPGKTVRLDFRVNPEEKPAIDETWVRFQSGWKPCAQEATAKGQWIWCRNPPQFRTFKMNGQECAVYPNCKE